MRPFKVSSQNGGGTLSYMHPYTNTGGPVVSFSDWERIDTMETSQGQRVGKPREKITSLQTMINIVNTTQ